MASKINPVSLSADLKLLGWTQRILSEKLEVGQGTVSRWITGKTEVPGYVAEYIRVVKIIKSAADEV